MYNAINLRVCFLLLPSIFYLTSSALWAGEVIQATSMNFGSIDFTPAGCIVTINAKNGAATPEATHAVVYGGESGKIRIRAQVKEQVQIEYNNSVTLQSTNDTIVITGVRSLSQYNNQYIDLEGNNIPIDIHIGGKLILDGSESLEKYSGEIKVKLTFTVL